MTANPNGPKDAKTATLELLARIAEATEQNTAAINLVSEELQALLAATETQAESMARMLEAMRAAIASPTRSQPAVAAGTPAAADPQGNYRDFLAESIQVGINDQTGEFTYKITGHPFKKFGVRVWPEVLPLLGIDPGKLQPGPNPFSAYVRAQLTDSGSPRKVISLAAGPQSPPAEDPDPATKDDIPF